VLALVCERYHFVVHSFCQMSNHYHLLVETVEANLSQGMRQLNGVHTQHFNRRHKLVVGYANSIPPAGRNHLGYHQKNLLGLTWGCLAMPPKNEKAPEKSGA
jgi:REP element-mobilizing transposase RayT